MKPEDFQAELDKNEAEKKGAAKDQASQKSLEQAKKEVVAAVVASTRANMKHREDTTTKVEVQNDLAETDDINRAVEAINNVAVLLLAQGQQKSSVNLVDGTDLGERFSELGKQLSDLLTEVKNDTKNDKTMQAVTKQLDGFIKQLKSLQVAPDPELKDSLSRIEKVLSALDVKPNVNVAAPKVTVQGKEVDLSPLTSLLDNISTTLAKLPTERDDNTDVIAALGAVNDAIHGLVFPVANYVLPFKDVNGKAVQVQLDASGNVPTSGGGGGGGGTQYTDGSSTIAHPIGTIPVFDKGGTITAVSSANPLPTSATVDTTGLATSAKQDTGNTSLGNIDTSTAAVNTVLGAKTDAKSTATDATSVSTMQVLKEISFMEQNPASRAVTNAGTFAVQATLSAETTKVIGTVNIAAAQTIAVTNAGTFAVQTTLNGVPSTVNSTTANLAGAAVFTGTSEDVSNYAAIQISVFSSHASATDGLSFQQSSNGTNWDITDTYTIPATTGKVFSVQPAAQFFRLVYTNGGTLTTSLRIQTVFHVQAPNPSSQRSSDAYTNEADLTQQWVFNSLYNGTTWDRMRGDITNGLDVDVTRLPALVAGAAVIGKVGIDQTTPGTTNLVAADITKVAGSAISQGHGTAATAIRVELPTDGTGVVGLNTGTNSIGKISDITTSVVPGTGATNLGKAEDAAHTTGDTGVFTLGVRNDGAATAFSGTNGDYTPVATDAQGRMYVVQKAPTATLTNVNSSATNVTILAANTGRIGAQFYNDSTAILYLKFGTTASTTSFTVPLAAATYYELPGGYTGNIDGIWASANGAVRVTELT